MNIRFRFNLLMGCLCAVLLAGCATDPQIVGLPQGTQSITMDSDVVVDNSEAAFAVYDDGFDLDLANVDLWGRIRHGFGMTDLQTDKVTEKEEWYRARPQYFSTTGERARRYLYYIVEELDKRNMPMELALLPFIESAFNPQAVSSAQAAGMWQFIPSTGRNFSLQQDIFRDERRDVIASTDAALDYLQKLYGMFGDWHLALAAYNWGEGNVLRAIENNKRAGKPTDYASLNMPRETQNYVPMLQALKNVIGNPLGFCMELPLIPNHPFFQVIAIERDIDVELAAQLAKISLAEFKALNPAVNKPVILAEVTSQILLPWDNAEVFMENLSLYKGRLSSWTVWKAPSTMSIAQVARATSMPQALLCQVNEIPTAVQVRQGSALLVYRTQGANQGNVTRATVENASLSFTRFGASTATLRNATPSKVAAAPPQHSSVVARNATPSKVAGASQPIRAAATQPASTRAASRTATATPQVDVAQSTAVTHEAGSNSPSKVATTR